MIFIDYIGFAAGTLTTVSFMPQVIKTWKIKETKDISLAMFLILAIGMILWLWYGILIKSFPVIIANLVSVVLCLIMIIFKLRYN